MPFKTAQSRENGKEAFLQIVQLMDDASKGVGRFSRDEAEDKPGMPWCLREQVKAVKKQGRNEIAKWPCLVCAKLFDTPEQLVAHSTVHNFDHQADDVYCCLCGLAFPSVVSLHLHLSPAIPVVRECLRPQCGADSLSRDEYSVHVCHCGPEEEEEANAIVSKLCPFENCVKTDLEEQDLDRHLRVGHGCQSKADVDNLKKLENGLSEEARCPICRQSFYNAVGGTGQTNPALMSHMALHCSEVAPLSRQSAKNIIQSAEAAGLDPWLAFSQELESSLLYVLKLLGLVSDKKSPMEDLSEPIRYLTLVMHRVRTSGTFQLQFDQIGCEGRLPMSPNRLGKLMFDAVNNDNALLDDMGVSNVDRERAKIDQSAPDKDILRHLINQMSSDA